VTSLLEEVSAPILRVEVNMEAAGSSQLLANFYEYGSFQNPNDCNVNM
jgi:hypothetical protein